MIDLPSSLSPLRPREERVRIVIDLPFSPPRPETRRRACSLRSSATQHPPSRPPREAAQRARWRARTAARVARRAPRAAARRGGERAKRERRVAGLATLTREGGTIPSFQPGRDHARPDQRRAGRAGSGRVGSALRGGERNAPRASSLLACFDEGEEGRAESAVLRARGRVKCARGRVESRGSGLVGVLCMRGPPFVDVFVVRAPWPMTRERVATPHLCLSVVATSPENHRKREKRQCKAPAKHSERRELQGRCKRK